MGQLISQKISFNPIIFDSSFDEKKLNFYNEEEFNFSYFSVMYFLKNINEKPAEALYAIDYTGEIEEKKIKGIIKMLTQNRFSSIEKSDLEFKYSKGIIKEAEYLREVEKDKKFCHFGDFDLIYSLFLEKYKINLIKERLNLNWFEYLFLLNNIFEEESNSLIERIKARNFKPRKGKGMGEFNEQGRKRKKIYSYYYEEEDINFSNGNEEVKKG